MNNKANKVFNIITTIILIFSICIMIFTIVSVTTIDKGNATIFGYKPYIVLSDSMRAEFEVGDVVISKYVDPATLKEGDIITFESIDPANYGGIMTHKIRSITTYEGNLAFVTYGTTTGVDDAYPVPDLNVLGQYKMHIPKLGYFFQFLKTVPGYFLLIFTPFMILIIMQGVRFLKLLKMYREQQNEEIAQQKAQLEGEKEKAQKMEEELAMLRAQLAQQQAQSATQQVNPEIEADRIKREQEKKIEEERRRRIIEELIQREKDNNNGTKL